MPADQVGEALSGGLSRVRLGAGAAFQAAIDPRQAQYQRELEAQRSQYARQRQLATGQIGRSVATAMGTTGNTTIGGRLAAREAGRVQGDLANAEAAAADQLRAQQVQREYQAQIADRDRTQQIVGGVIGGAGQVLGMAVPAFGALNGAGEGIGSALGLDGGGDAPTGTGKSGGGLVGQIGSALVSGAMGGPPPPPTPAPMSPSIAGLGGAGPIGPQQTPQMSAPSGEVESFEERMRRLQLGGGFR